MAFFFFFRFLKENKNVQRYLQSCQTVSLGTASSPAHRDQGSALPDPAFSLELHLFISHLKQAQQQRVAFRGTISLSPSHPPCREETQKSGPISQHVDNSINLSAVWAVVFEMESYAANWRGSSALMIQDAWKKYLLDVWQHSNYDQEVRTG